MLSLRHFNILNKQEINCNYLKIHLLSLPFSSMFEEKYSNDDEPDLRNYIPVAQCLYNFYLATDIIEWPLLSYFLLSFSLVSSNYQGILLLHWYMPRMKRMKLVE